MTVSAIANMCNPKTWFSSASPSTTQDKALNAASRFAILGLGAQSGYYGVKTAASISISKDDWQAEKIAAATLQLAAAAFAFRTAVS